MMSSLSLRCARATATGIGSLIIAIALTSGCGQGNTDSANPPAQEAPRSPESTASESTKVDPPNLSERQETLEGPADPTDPVQPSAKASDRKSVIAQADALRTQGRFGEAIELLKTLLIVDPDDAEILFRMATLAADDGDLASGIELLSGIHLEHPEAGLAAQGQSADWCMTLERFREAETRYRRVLERVPSAAHALRQLAFLLNREGRREEAAELVRQLCRLGNVRQDELHSLIAISDAMYSAPPDDRDADEGPNPGNSAPLYLPIPPYGDARRAFQERRFADVIRLLRPEIEKSVAPPAMVALFGRAAGESQDDAMIAWWFKHLPPQVTQFADYWATLGILELMGNRYETATRALGEALQRDPTDLSCASRMRQALGSLGKKKEAQLWFDRWTDLRATLDANNRVAAHDVPDLDSVESLASALDKLDRPLEAVLWRATVAHGDAGKARMIALNDKRKELLANGNAFPDSSSRLCGLDLKNYPLPDRGKLALQAANEIRRNDASGDSQILPPVFSNLAESTGMRHSYRVAGQPLDKHYSIYQTLGGGVAVLDYDLDGRSDIYFAQGAADPPRFQSRLPNQLFRNGRSTLDDVTSLAKVEGSKYTLGVTAGDWNQDGFPDLGVSGIGECVLLINNGDGTFALQTLHITPRSDRAPSSIGIADVTGDNLPDVVQLGYVDDPDMIEKSPLDDEGNVLITVGPSSFDPATDFLFSNTGDGSFEFRRLTEKGDARTGLGLIVGDFDEQTGNEVFIGNDSLPNRLWKIGRQSEQTDLAAILGCAYGFSGGATGAMGIAVGDFDQNSEMDLHVTNYENENSNLYLKKGLSFQDRNRQYRLGEASKDLVGFGTQVIDYDNDGDDDLVVANGHLDNAKSIRGTFPQPLQLFCNAENQFRLLEVKDPTGFWNMPRVGRALATLDFNRDGQTDFVVTQMEMPSALLVNETDSGNHWLQIVLAGTKVERDAIGARVTVTRGAETTVRWNVAGDGYLCNNDRALCFGLGADSVIDSLEVQWPSGGTQSFEDVAVDQRVMIVEGEPTLFTLP